MNVLIADDSIVFRTAVKIAIQSLGDNYEITTASNGKIAVDFVKSKQFDIIIMDLEMPEMNGHEAITEIRKFNLTIPIIVFSAVSIEGANKTLKALELGANDFVQKIQAGNSASENIENIKKDLNPKIRALIGAINTVPTITKKTINLNEKIAPSINLGRYNNFIPSLILIGSSTGGPDALLKLFSKLKERISAPIVIVQHMPPIFTTQLANMLNRSCQFNVVEAKGGEVLKSGNAYLAPGDFHLTIHEKNGVKSLQINQSEKVCYVRPAVDVTLMSVAKSSIQGNILVVMLTGMGEDGTAGVRALKSKNIKVVIQDQISSVVWGMPGSLYEQNLHDDVASLDDISQLINIIG